MEVEIFILYFLRMSSIDLEGVEFDVGCSKVCADNRADTLGVASLKVSWTTFALVCFIGVSASVFSILSFFGYYRIQPILNLHLSYDTLQKSSNALPYDPAADYLSSIIIDTTSQHGKHFFDVNCKVCSKL